jgi:hypothetical protein
VTSIPRRLHTARNFVRASENPVEKKLGVASMSVEKLFIFTLNRASDRRCVLQRSALPLQAG